MRGQSVPRATIHAQYVDAQGLASSEFDLHYQIQVDRKKRAVGAEALIRWNIQRAAILRRISLSRLRKKLISSFNQAAGC